MEPYEISVVRKQLECSREEAERVIGQLGPEKVEELVEAATNARMHVVRRLLGLPVPDVPEATPAVEIALGETVVLPARTAAIRLRHIRRHSAGGLPPEPIAVLDVVPAEEGEDTDGEDGADEDDDETTH